MRRLFDNPQFRRLFAGRLVTNAGDSLYAVATMWLVYSLSGSTFYTGLAGFLTFGMQAAQAFVGPLVDRWSLRRTLVGTQAAQAVLVLIIPAAYLLGALTVEIVLVVMPLLSLLNQFVYPAQTAALPRIVAEDELADANAAFSFAYQGSEAAFNALGGVLIAAVGAVSLFVVNSLTFAIAVLLFAGLRVPPAERHPEDGEGYLEELRAGASFLRASSLWWLFGASILANAIFGGTIAVLPAFAEGLGGADTYGFLLAALAVGSVLGALVAGRFQQHAFGRLAVVGFAASALAWVGALLVPGRPATVALFALAMVPVGVTNVLAATLVQKLVPAGLLGRVTAVVGSAATAAMPLGALLGGALGAVYGPEAVLWAGVVAFAWLVVYSALVPAIRWLPSPVEARPLTRGETIADVAQAGGWSAPAEGEPTAIAD
jgi:MFS family permease